MGYDIPQSISHGSLRAQDEENRRIREISDKLHSLCRVYEAQCGVGEQNVTHFEIEQRVAEKYAKEHNIWLPMEKVFSLGVPGPSGNENDTYVGEEYIYKVNNLLNCGGILNLLEKIIIHNEVFPETYYTLSAFTGFDGRTVMPIMRQKRIANAEPSPQIAIDTYMAAIGFYRDSEMGRYSNTQYEVWDLIPRNVLRDSDGDIYVVDAELRKL